MQRSHRFGFVTLAVVLALVGAGCGSDNGSNPVNPPPTLELNSPNLGNGAVYAHLLANAGTYPYHCKFHSGMTGTVTVDASAANMNASVSIGDNSFTPNSTTIKPGGTVTWTNNGASTHSVTSN
jgi:uncharacterized protein (UPF0333 family)